MLVRDCMTRHPVMIQPTTPAAEIQKIMNENEIRHLPVIGDGKVLLGLITRSRLALKADQVGSLNVWEITRYFSHMTATDIMIKAAKVKTIDPNRTIERAANIMSKHKIGCLPVLEDGIVIGILSEVDLLRSYQEMLGLKEPGLRVTIRMPDRSGEFARLMEALGRHKVGVVGIGTFPTRRMEGYYDAVIKTPNCDAEAMKRIVAEISDHEIVDMRDAFNM